MTKFEDNPSPYLTIVEATEPSAPSSGRQRLYIDSTTHLLKATNSSGTDRTNEGISAGAITSSGLTQATARLLGRTTASTGAVEEITVGTGLTLSGGSLTASGGGGGGTYGTVQRALVDPTGLTWSWVNQGVASVATSGAVIYESSPAEATDSIHFRVKALANSKPYTEIFHITPQVPGINFSAVIVGWMVNASSNFAGLVQLWNSSGVVMNSSIGSSNQVTSSYLSDSGAAGGFWQWIALTDDSSDRRIWISRDGNNWLLFHSVATNSNITPDRIMFGIEARNATFPSGLIVDSVETHTGSTP